MKEVPYSEDAFKRLMPKEKDEEKEDVKDDEIMFDDENSSSCSEVLMSDIETDIEELLDDEPSDEYMDVGSRPLNPRT